MKTLIVQYPASYVFRENSYRVVVLKIICSLFRLPDAWIFPLSFYIYFVFCFLDYNRPSWSPFPWNLSSPLKTWHSSFVSYIFTFSHLLPSSWPILWGQSKLILVFCSPLSTILYIYPFSQFQITYIRNSQNLKFML